MYFWIDRLSVLATTYKQQAAAIAAANSALASAQASVPASVDNTTKPEAETSPSKQSAEATTVTTEDAVQQNAPMPPRPTGKPPSRPQPKPPPSRPIRILPKRTSSEDTLPKRTASDDALRGIILLFTLHIVV